MTLLQKLLSRNKRINNWYLRLTYKVLRCKLLLYSEGKKVSQSSHTLSKKRLRPVKNLPRLKKFIFTYIFDNYDNLKDPLVITPGWEYLCFSDKKINNTAWTQLDTETAYKNIKCSKRKASLLKIEHAKQVPPDCDIVVTLDGSMLLNTNLDDFINEFWEEGIDLLIARHPLRDCIYDEAEAVMNLKLDTPENVIPQMQRYFHEGFPPHQGLYGTRMMIKNNKSSKLRVVCEIWADEYKRGSRRDQLSLNYAIWKANKEGIHLNIKELDFDWLYHKSGMFQIRAHNR